MNQLEVLLTVAREKSFSRAADALGRTQPAVSQAIRRLEDETGETLFDRSSKDGTLTPAGELLVGYARQMLNLRDAAGTAIRELRDLKSGKVTLSANEHTVFCLLPMIEEFRRRHPAIKIVVQRGVASRIPEQITAREVEIGVISFKPSDPSLRSVFVLNDELTLLVARKHPLARRSSVSLRELESEHFIAHNAPSPYRLKVIEAFAKHNITLNIAVELPSLEAIKRLVEANAGIALVPKLTAMSEIAAGRVAALSVSELRLERRLNFVYRKNAVLSYAAREFLDLAVKIGHREMRPADKNTVR